MSSMGWPSGFRAVTREETMRTKASRLALQAFGALAAGALAFSAHAQQGKPLDFGAYQIKVTRLADHLYVAEAAPGVGNVVFLTGQDGVLLVDSMFPQLHDKLVAAIRATGATGPIRYVINTHLHNDHTSGNTLMAKDGATIVAQDNVLKRMKTAKRRDGRPAYPETDWPKQTYADRQTIHFDGEDVELIHPPAAHTDGDTLVYFKHANVMAEGDLPGSIRFNNIGVDDGGSVDGMIAGGKLIMSIANPQTKIVPGHLGPVVGFKEITVQDAMFQAVRDRVAKLISEGKTLQQVLDAKPTADFNEGRMGGNITPNRFTTLIYTDLSRRMGKSR
jgi:glyoxylase-like metal-dependent hydrolase (beta-lactamase superfamily II)